MMQFENIVFWSYIVLLLAGGLFGFFRAHSKVSLLTAAVAAAILVLTRVPGLFGYTLARDMENIIMAVLIVVFAIRLTKTKKFIPSGLLLLLTAVVLALMNIRRTG
jgi:uncharacterized membrane protein (UPF0136 family)